MSYVEGVGDEVTILFTILIASVLIYIAWLSTSVSERPLVRIVVLDRARFQEFLQRFVQRNSHPILQNEASDERNTPPDRNIVAESTPSVHHDDKSMPVLNSETAVHVSQSDHAPGASGPDPSPEGETSDGGGEEPRVDGVPSVDDQQAASDVPQVSQAFLDSFLSSTRPECPGRSPDKNDESAQSTVSDTVSGAGQLPSATESHSEPYEVSGSDDGDEEQASTDSDNPQTEEALLDGYIRIRLKYLDERQKLVQARPEDTIGQFKRAHFSVELADNFSVRFIFRGQELREECSTLRAYHIEDNSVIHCLLSRISQTEPPANQSQPFNLDLGFLMFPLFGLILGLLWYCRIVYRSYFNAVSTLSLVGITFLFLAALLASWRREERFEHED